MPRKLKSSIEFAAGSTSTAISAAPAANAPPVFAPGAFTVDEFCRWSRTGRTAAYGEIKAGRLRVVKVGKRTLVPVENARAWLSSLPEASKAEERAA